MFVLKCFHLEPKPEHLTLTALACDAAQHDAHLVLLCIPSMVHPEKLQGEANARRYHLSASCCTQLLYNTHMYQPGNAVAITGMFPLQSYLDRRLDCAANH